MSDACIMLAKTYQKGKVDFPALVSEKLDGVAADVYVEKDDAIFYWTARTRQGEPMPAISHIIEWFEEHVTPAEGLHFIGEIYIRDKDFKEISGLARRKVSDSDTDSLCFYIYDFYSDRTKMEDYEIRSNEAEQVLPVSKTDEVVQYVQNDTIVNSDEDVQLALNAKLQANPYMEGIVIRSLRGKNSKYQVGKRPSGMTKLKLVNTIDIPIVGFEVAVEGKTGKPKGMVGRLVCAYKKGEIGVGPGKLTHEERIDLYENFPKYQGRMIEVAYMPDASYDALREPRFIRFRPDKDKNVKKSKA